MRASNFPEAGDSPAASGSSPPAADAAGVQGPVAVRVWDLPLRLFHWLLVLCLTGSFITIKVGGSWTEWHLRFGYVALALILFRVLWGLIGPRYARFSSFLFPPGRVLAYLRNSAHAPRTLGHSPLGALSVFALLAAVGVQAGAGLFTSDDISVEGPLARLVSNALVERASWLHHNNEWVILGLVGLHLGAILYYRVFKRQSLVLPMVVGDKRVARSPAEPAPALLAARDDAAIRLRAAIAAAVAAATTAVIVYWPIF